MAYVDGFVVPVPKKNVEAYKKMARTAGKVWMDHGALEYHETMADDVKPGKWTSFPQSVKLKKDEVVFFSWIVYRSRKQRDSVMAKVMKDKRLAKMMDPKSMPFDGKRMIYGGFKVVVAFQIPKVLGAKGEMKMHYSESPQPCPQGMPPAFGMVAHKFGVPWKVLVNKA